MYIKNRFIYYFLTTLFLLITYSKCQIKKSFLVSVQKIINFHNYRHIGSGTIISEEWILSTAFVLCSSEIIVIGKSCSPKYMYLILPNVTNISYYNLSGDNIHVVSKIFVHPEFHIDLENLFNTNPDHNIALLRLKSKLIFSKFIQPISIIQIFSNDITSSEYCIIIGWAANIPYGNKYLSSGNIKTQPDASCKSEDTDENYAKFCADCKDCKDPCFIDAGSPLVCKNQLTAIVLRELNWCSETISMLRIDLYNEWIKYTMESQPVEERMNFRSEDRLNFTEKKNNGLRKVLTHWLISLLIFSLSCS